MSEKEKSFDSYVRGDDPPMCGNCAHWNNHDDAAAGFCLHPNNQLSWEVSTEIKGAKNLKRTVPVGWPVITTDRQTCTMHDVIY